MINMYGNPYYNPTPRYQPMDPMSQPMNTQSFIPPVQQTNAQSGLLGKSVDSIDVVKSMDIPLDGRVSYFPLMDGSAIVTKKLQNDGTSKIVIYKPVEENEKELPKYITMEEIEGMIPDIDIDELRELKDEIKTIRKQIREIKDKVK